MSALPSAQFVPSAARTTNGSQSANTPEAEFGNSIQNLVVSVDVTAASGTTPNLALAIEWSPNGVDWFTPDGTADTFTALTTTGKKVKAFPVKGDYFRLVWTITGTTPSFTFSAYAFGV